MLKIDRLIPVHASQLQRPLLTVVAIVLLAGSVRAESPTTKPSCELPWEKEIASIEARDRATPPPQGGVLFAGSSSIRMWSSLPQDFPDVAVVNHAFGGSEIRLQSGAGAAHRDGGGETVRIHLPRSGREDDRTSRQPGQVGLQGAGIGVEILVGGELGGIDEDRHHHMRGALPGFRRQCDMPGMQRPHGRHHGDARTAQRPQGCP